MPSFTRRGMLIAGVGTGAVVVATRGVAAQARDTRLYAGGYAAEGGAGVQPLQLTAAGQWRRGVAVPDARDASFGLDRTANGRHYLLEEGDEGHLSTWDVAAGRWQRRSRVSTGGASPCHLALDRTGTALAVANYSSGSVMLLRLDRATGLPVGEGVVRQHKGSGPNKDRQATPHAHWVGFSPDNRWLWSVDLGADAIFAHAYDAARGTLGETKMACRLDPGAGPRHMVLHPTLPRAYVVTELSNSVVTLRPGSDGTFAVVDRTSTLPVGFGGASYGAAIVIDRAGRHLYVSNRGHDSVAVFGIDGSGGLTLVQHIACGGHWPRYMRMLDDGRHLLVANQRSGAVAAFAVARDGRLAPFGAKAAVPGIAFIGVAG